jgi:hypothetical protein
VSGMTRCSFVVRSFSVLGTAHMRLTQAPALNPPRLRAIRRNERTNNERMNNEHVEFSGACEVRCLHFQIVCSFVVRSFISSGRS